MKNTKKINRFILIFIFILFLIVAFFPISTTTDRTYHFPNCYTDKIQELRFGPVSPGHIEKYNGDCEEFFNTFYYHYSQQEEQFIKETFGFSLEEVGYGKTRFDIHFLGALISLFVFLVSLGEFYDRKIFQIALFCLSIFLLLIIFLPKFSSDWHNFFSWWNLQAICTHTPARCPLSPELACDDHMYKFGTNVTMEAPSGRPELQDLCSKWSEKISIVVYPGCKITNCSIISFPPPQVKSELGAGFYLVAVAAIIALIYSLVNLSFLKPWKTKEREKERTSIWEPLMTKKTKEKLEVLAKEGRLEEYIKREKQKFRIVYVLFSLAFLMCVSIGYPDDISKYPLPFILGITFFVTLLLFFYYLFTKSWKYILKKYRKKATKRPGRNGIE